MTIGEAVEMLSYPPPTGGGGDCGRCKAREGEKPEAWQRYGEDFFTSSNEAGAVISAADVINR